MIKIKISFLNYINVVYKCLLFCSDTICCGLLIRPVEEQLKQQVIGKRYYISRKRKSYKGSTSRTRLAVRLSNGT